MSDFDTDREGLRDALDEATSSFGTGFWATAERDHMADSLLTSSWFTRLLERAEVDTRPMPHASVGSFTRADCRCEIGVDHRMDGTPCDVLGRPLSSRAGGD